MKIGRVFSYLFASMVYVTYVGAIFFTDSKDNDYPRIGKRPLPSSVYKTWLTQNEKIEYFPYAYDLRPDSADGGFNREIKDYDNAREPTRLQLPENMSSRGLHKRIMSYLTSEDDLNF